MSTAKSGLKKTRVLYIAAECKPFSKAGGVGDVAGELPFALQKKGYDVHIVTPYYSRIDSVLVGQKEGTYSVEFNGDKYEIGVYEGVYKGMKDGPKVHLVKNASFFDDQKLSGPAYGTPYLNSIDFPYKDDALRFSFFSEACLPLIKEYQPQIVHANDWPLGYLFGRMKMRDTEFGNIRRVLTVHNMDYQGNFWIEHARKWGTMSEILGDRRIGHLFMDPHEDWDSVNALRLALELADMVNTVSPTYAEEIRKPTDDSKYFVGGRGLDSVCKQLHEEGRLVGILNGFEYDPNAGTDAAFQRKLEDKAKMRANLLKRFIHLKDPNALLIGFVGRLVEQKVKLFEGEFTDDKGTSNFVFGHLLNSPRINLILSGVDGGRATFLESFAERPNFSCNVGFDTKLAGEIMLGSDVFLMPSLYEPCGITQLAAMSNATPPIVRWTGGLPDTVTAYDGNGRGTGFGFDGSTKEEVLRNLMGTVHAAHDLYFQQPDRFKELQRRAFDVRFTWDQSVVEYAKLYEAVLSRSPRQ